MITIANTTFTSRLFLGSGKYGSSTEMYNSIIASGTEMVTVALKRIDASAPSDDILDALKAALDIKITERLREKESGVYSPGVSLSVQKNPTHSRAPPYAAQTCP